LPKNERWTTALLAGTLSFQGFVGAEAQKAERPAELERMQKNPTQGVLGRGEGAVRGKSPGSAREKG